MHKIAHLVLVCMVILNEMTRPFGSTTEIISFASVIAFEFAYFFKWSERFELPNQKLCLVPVKKIQKGGKN